MSLGMSSGAYACLTIADSGVGMDKNLTGKIDAGAFGIPNNFTYQQC